MADFGYEERPVSKKRKPPSTDEVEAPPSPWRTNPMDSIIRDMEGVRSRIAEYELQMQ